MDLVLIVINRLFEFETTAPFTAILLTRSSLSNDYLSSSCPQSILCCSVRLYVLKGLFFSGFGVGAKITHRVDPIYDHRICRFEYSAGLNCRNITLDFFGIC